MSNTKNPPKGTKGSPLPTRRRKDEGAETTPSSLHVYAEGRKCVTDTRGYPTPRNRSPAELKVDASEGFIPLWADGVTLRWRFAPETMDYFEEPQAAGAVIEGLLGDALLAWGDAVPVEFSKRDDAWDFEVVMQPADDCDINGCTLASAFFPDAGRHRLRIYPEMFEQTEAEQVETMAHELGHVFGLRHFFADISETSWPSEVFGEDEPFSIMNYGAKSRLTDADRFDLKRLYKSARSGLLTEINGTPIRLVYPFHSSGASGMRAPLLRVGVVNQNPQCGCPCCPAQVARSSARRCP